MDTLPGMSDERGGRPRDARLHDRILAATRELLASGSYTALSMEAVAARAEVGKKTLYRRWPSKAPLVAEAVLDAYGRRSSFRVADTGDLRADLSAWFAEHAEFVADPSSAALIRAIVAAAAASPSDSDALYQQLNAPQREGLISRLRQAAERGEIRDGVDVEAVANAMIGSLLLHTLSASYDPHRSAPVFDGLVDVLLHGVAVT